MLVNVFIFWTVLLVFQLGNNVYSKSVINSNYRSDRHVATSNHQMQQRLEDNEPSVYSTYRSRHKYKVINQKNEFRRSRYYENDKPEQRECAIMYRNQEPIGILQPFEKSFKLLPVNGEKIVVEIDNQIPVVPKSDVYQFNEDYTDGAEAEQKAKFRDDTYPSIFTQFKIDSKLDQASENQKIAKRELLKPSPIKTNEQIEEELQNILNEMGLIDEDPRREEKRESLKEDENLEQGTNKINLIKEDSSRLSRRLKRDEVSLPSKIEEKKPDVTEISDEISDIPFTTLNSVNKDNFRKKREKSQTPSATSVKTSLWDFDNKRKKRQKPTIVEDLEKSGDLKFSGNKSPLASETSIPDANTKLSEYEKRVERDIQNKIKALKEEVKREIESLKVTESKEGIVKDDFSRKKRQVVNTLIDKESAKLDPNFNSDEKLQPHIRRRRSIHTKHKEFKTQPNVINAKLSVNDSHINFQVRKLNQYIKNSEDNINNITNVTPSTRIKREINLGGQFDEEDAQFEEKKSKSTCSGKECGDSKHCNCEEGGNCKNCHNSQVNLDNLAIPYGQDNSVYDQSNLFDENSPDFDPKPVMKRNNDIPYQVNKKRNLIPIYEDNIDYSNEYENSDVNMVKRKAEDNIKAGFLLDKPDQRNTYFVDLHPETYRMSPYYSNSLYEPDENVREKRQNFKDLMAFHGGGPVENHIVAIRSRRMFQPQPHTRFRRTVYNNNNNMEQPRQLIDMSDEDLFGALPQSFEGELSRYKRVKRTEN